MDTVTLLTGIGASIVGMGAGFFAKRCDPRSRLKSFIENIRRPIILTDTTEIRDANRKALAFFGVDSVEDLRKKSRFVSRLFKEIQTDETRHMESIDWVTRVNPERHIRVQAKHDKLSQTFTMYVTKVDDDLYMLDFHNISKIIAEKNQIVERVEMDPLTHIYNRKKFDTTLTETIRHAQIYEKTFCVILFDIDDLKKINDTHGEDAGNNILIQTATLIRNTLRNSDMFARWQGGTFAVLSESCSLKEGEGLANRLRNEIASFSFPVVGSVTCSFGVAEYQQGESAEKLMKRADIALYRSKKEGKNRVTLAPND